MSNNVEIWSFMNVFVDIKGLYVIMKKRLCEEGHKNGNKKIPGCCINAGIQ